MGSRKPTPTTRSHASPNRLRQRACLRKGCPRHFQPACWNQRYCQDPECLCEVRRWQAARRQRKYRQQPLSRQKHASAEQKRRAVRRTGRCENTGSSSETSQTRGRAWSRSKPSLGSPICHRPGCYESPRDSPRRLTRYCSDRCHQDVRRVWDRERKYLMRNRPRVQAQRRLEYQATQAKRRLSKRAASSLTPGQHSRLTPHARSADIAAPTRARYPPALSKQEPDHDSKTNSRFRADSSAGP